MEFVPTTPPTFQDEVVPEGTRLVGLSALVSALKSKHLFGPFVVFPRSTSVTERKVRMPGKSSTRDIGRATVLVITLHSP